MRIHEPVPEAGLWAITSANASPTSPFHARERSREREPRHRRSCRRGPGSKARAGSAGVLLRTILEGAIGHRDDGLPANFDAGVSQTPELGGKRGARVAGPEAALAREIALSDDTARRVVREVAATFFNAVEATERVRLARVTETSAAEIARIAQRRHEQGDIPVLEVNVAQSALARTRADAYAADAARATAVGDLRGLLGLDPAAPVLSVD